MLVTYLLKRKKSIFIYVLINILSVILLLNVYSIYGRMFSLGLTQSDYISIATFFAIELLALLILVDISAYLQFNISYSASQSLLDRYRISTLSFLDFIMSNAQNP